MRKNTGSEKSHDRLLAAITELLDTRTVTDKITITDIVSAAGLTRPTFYAVFDDLPSAFAASALARLKEAFDGMTVDPSTDSATRSKLMQTAFATILHRLSEHADFFARVLQGPGGPQVHSQIIKFIAARIRESSPVAPALATGILPAEMTSSAIAAGVVWTMIRWMDADPRPAVEHVAKQLQLFVEASVFGGLNSIGENQ